jgi:hypothetical protein
MISGFYGCSVHRVDVGFIADCFDDPYHRHLQGEVITQGPTSTQCHHSRTESALE